MKIFRWIIASCLCFMLLAYGEAEPSHPRETNAVNVPALMDKFTIVSDEYLLHHKRTVEVMLNEELSEEQLTTLAISIKAAAKQSTDRTFIGYRVSGSSEAGYWATTHYNPDLEVKIL